MNAIINYQVVFHLISSTNYDVLILFIYLLIIVTLNAMHSVQYLPNFIKPPTTTPQ